MLKDGTVICTTTYKPGRGARVATKTFHPSVSLLERVRHCLPRGAYCLTTDNEYAKPQWADDTFEKTLVAGRSYLANSDMPMDDFIKSHRSYIPEFHWLRYAVEWAFANPDSCLKVETLKLSYRVCKRGDCVEIGLPHHDRGGEKHWVVSEDKPRCKILINVD